MIKESGFTVGLARLARLPFSLLARRPFVQPHKVLILKPCCVSQVMLATPLLAVLSEAFPAARFDWAVSDWARPVIVGNPRLTELISTGSAGLPHGTWSDVRELIGQLRAEQYDTCIIPSRSSLLSYIAWRAGIPQRIGLHVNGRGFAHTLPVTPVSTVKHEAAIYLSLAQALSLDHELVAAVGQMEFYPPDLDRTAVTARLVEQIDWLGEEPLAIIHPGGGYNPVRERREQRWPAERYARLCNYLVRQRGARVILVGAAQDREVAAAVAGMMPVPVVNLAGEMGLGELGALCEVADLYVGNDTGATHVAAASGCPTLAIFGPTDPAVSGPYLSGARVRTLRAAPAEGEFRWAQGVTVETAVAAVTQLLAIGSNS